MQSNLPDLNQTLSDIYKRGQKPPVKMTLPEWADTNRFLSETSGEKWFTSTQEIARGPMLAVTESGVRTITAMVATQLLKTELILNVIGYFSHLDPCPILVVQPKEELAKKFSTLRLKQMIKSSPSLRDLFGDERSRDATSTASFREFKGGHVAIVSAKSPSNLAMFAIRVTLLDEIDKYDSSSGNEGDPVALAEERMSKYSTNSLSIRCCSPTLKGLSRIESSYDESDKRKPFVSCPHCQHKQILLWKNVHWDKDEEGKHLPETTSYHCEACGAAWTEFQRLTALKHIYWRQTAEFDCKLCGHENFPISWASSDDHKWTENGIAICEECQKGKCPNTHAGFWANKMYSQFRPISDIVRLWIDSQGNLERLKMFINTQLAEAFDTPGEQIRDIEWLTKRKEKFEGDLPREVGIITAGIDVQETRIEIETVGWGKEEESWSLEHKIIGGDPKSPETWKQVDLYLKKPFYRNDGRHSFIAAACIDTGGHHTQYTMNYCRDRMSRRIWPIRGIGGDGKAYPVWPSNPSRGKYKIPFYNIGVDSAKNTIFGRLFIEQHGAGYCHFPDDRTDEWFKQLIAEKRVTKYRGSSKILVWENPKRARNEAFDCRVYAYAALCGLQQSGWNLNSFTESNRLILLSDDQKINRENNDFAKPKSKLNLNRKIVKSNFMDS